jgi:hypothetical protein
MNLPVFGQAIYDGISCELDRVNDFRSIVTKSVVPNENMDHSTIEDNEIKYGIDTIISSTNQERIDRIIEAAQRDGNGGPDWIQEQIQKAGYPLYVILNTIVPDGVVQFGTFQFSTDQFGGTSSYTNPALVPGELVASSPNGNVGPLFEQFGSFQFGTGGFGTLVPDSSNPRPREFSISTDPNVWGYFFFLSPFPDRLALSNELLQLSDQEFNYLKKLVIKLKHARNWAIVQAEVI